MIYWYKRNVIIWTDSTASPKSGPNWTHVENWLVSYISFETILLKLNIKEIKMASVSSDSKIFNHRRFSILDDFVFVDHATSGERTDGPDVHAPITTSSPRG